MEFTLEFAQPQIKSESIVHAQVGLLFRGTSTVELTLCNLGSSFLAWQTPTEMMTGLETKSWEGTAHIWAEN